MVNEKIVYKILNTKTGLYSKGGTNPKFSKNGKTWTSKGALSNHFRLIADALYNRYNSYRAKNPYKDCVIEEYRITEVNINSIDAYSKLEALKEDY